MCIWEINHTLVTSEANEYIPKPFSEFIINIGHIFYKTPTEVLEMAKVFGMYYI